MAENTKLYVGNLSWGTTRDDLYQLFAGFGEVQDAFIPLDRESGRSRGFGFVTFSTPDQAAEAMKSLDTQQFQGRELRVNFASPQGDKGGRSGRGGYGGGGGGYNQGYGQNQGYNQGGY